MTAPAVMSADRFLGRMSATTRATALVVLLHLPFIVATIAFSVPRHDLSPLGATLTIATLCLVGALQLHHSLAATHGRRPAFWPVTFLVLTVAVYAPLPIFTWDWVITQWFFIASSLMLLPRRLALVAAAAPIVGVVVASHLTYWGVLAPLDVIFYDVYIVVVIGMGAIALASSARLVGVIEELDQQRTALARVAVDRERLRISRDLHDLLGHSLSAVSLKGDLALRLLDTDRGAARAEVESLTDVARSALRDMRSVSQDQHSVSLHTEIEAAASLLGAAGIEAVVDVAAIDLDRSIEEVFAWAVREGTTNVLLHSAARRCTITLGRDATGMRLEIANDGAHGPVEQGSGIAGISDRARTRAGTVVAERTDDDRFTLVVHIPEPSR